MISMPFQEVVKVSMAQGSERVVDTAEYYEGTISCSLRKFLRSICLLTSGTRLAPNLMNFACVIYTKTHGIANPLLI